MKLTQAEKLRRLLSDGETHSTPEILEKVYGGSHMGIARLAARVHDLKAKGHEIMSWRDAKNKTVWWYQMKVAPPVQYERVVIDGIPHARIVQTRAMGAYHRVARDNAMEV